MGLHIGSHELEVIGTNVLLENFNASIKRFCNQRWTFNDKASFVITKTATPYKASQSLNPRVR
jgi:hypothetical protein